MSLSLLYTRSAGGTVTSANDTAEFQQLITGLNTVIDTTMPGIAAQQVSDIADLTTTVNNNLASISVDIAALTATVDAKTVSWAFSQFFGTGAASSLKNVWIAPAGTTITVTKVKIVFVDGSASGTTTILVKKNSGGVVTTIQSAAVSGAGDAINVVKSYTVSVSLAENDFISFTTSATGSQHAVTITVQGSQKLS